MASTHDYRNTLLSSDLDDEDLDYLQKAFQSSFQEMCDINNEIVTGQRPINNPNNERNDAFDSQNCNKDNCNNGDVNNSKDDVIFPLLNRWQVSEKIFHEIVNNGIDNEDIGFLKKSFQILERDESESKWIHPLKWIPHPATAEENTFNENGKVDASDGVSSSRSGCARTEGYTKRVLKCSYRQEKNKENEPESCGSSRFFPYSKTFKVKKQTLSRDARNDQRRLSTAYEAITHSKLLTLNQLKFRKKKLRLGKSDIHGYGVFAAEPIGPNEIIIEYVGQIIRPIIADLREVVYKKSGIGFYCFLIDDSTVVDATKHGNINRYINHSCNPNSYAKIVVINNQKKIVIYSKKHIKVDEEITYDYKMKIEDDKIACFCKAPGCRKSLN